MKDYATLGKEVLTVLNNHGYEAYFVGGFVRDFLLGIPSMDIDIASSATPEEVAALFPKTKNTGAKFGTVTVLYGDFAFEVTTFRTDGTYSDHRHPETVRYSTTLKEDLTRRDFTVNSLAMDKTGRIHDLCGGMADLQDRLIRAIGDPDRRFREDALRILRAFRFVSKLDFTIEPLTLDSIRRNHGLLADISVERIMQEFKHILSHPHALKAFRAMDETSITETISDLAEGIRFLSKQDAFSLDHFQFYALCFYLHGSEIGDDWRFSNKERQIIGQLMTLLDVTENDRFNEELVFAYGKDLCLRANEIGRLLRPGSDQETRIVRIDEELPIRKTCDLVFKGQDILENTDVKDARVIGEAVSDLVLMVITRQLPNEYLALKNHALIKIKELESEGNEHGN